MGSARLKARFGEDLQLQFECFSRAAEIMLRPTRRLAALPFDAPKGVLALYALITLAALPGLARLELRTDGHALVPAREPAVVFDLEARAHFHLRDPLVILIESRDRQGVLNLRTLSSVREISDLLSRLPPVRPDDVVSLATEHRNRVYTGSLRFRPFLDPLPDTPELAALLAQDLHAARGVIDGTLISADRRATTILLGMPPVDPLHPYDRAALVRRVVAAVRPFENATDRIDVVGPPAAESLLGEHILADLSLLLPLSLMVIGLVVWLGTRRWAALAVAALKIVCCLVWTFGLMGWLGSPIYLTTAVLPVILVTVGLASEIHILWHYQRTLARPGALDLPPPEALRQAFSEVGRPVLWSALTTAFGFFSFGFSPLAPVRAFGFFAGLGVLFCLAGSLTLVPAILALLSPSALAHPGHGAGRTGRSGGLARAASPFLARPRATLGALLLATVALGLGTTRLSIQDSWVDGFSPNSPFRLATNRANERLFGTHLLLAHLHFKSPGALLDPARLEALGRFEAEVRRLPGVGGVLGPYSHMAAVQALWKGEGQIRAIPATAEGVEELVRMFDLGRGAERRREVIDDSMQRTVVTLFLKDANFQETARLMGDLRAASDRLLGRYGAHLDFAGDVAVSQAMIPAIVKTQVSSVAGSLLGCLVALYLLHRSLRIGLIAVLPTALSTLWIFGLMGWLGIPLGVATSMFCAITIGIGDDYAIHFIDRYRAARGEGAENPALEAIREAGPAILVDTLAIALGFGLLAASRVPANAHLGLLVALALVAGCLLTLLGLGSLLETKLGLRWLGSA
ncbi:MAG TPA: MMPL family transporter [Thermoanaerobaculia bacterium]|nr:MMPL family transporter [Thermoanaerobaculia bacterium]